MLRTSETETEILLGNKQLLGIFFVVAVLLGVAFYGGYMVGRGVTPKKNLASVPASTDDTTTTTPSHPTSAEETHSFPADSANNSDTASTSSTGNTSTEAESTSTEPPLGAPKHDKPPKSEPPVSSANVASNSFEPQPGEQFLQVAAVGKDEAEAVADVLQKKGFLAHAVPKPGNPKIYRVLIGPMKDAGDLNNTRDSLRRTGFREVIVQHY